MDAVADPGDRGVRSFNFSKRAHRIDSIYCCTLFRISVFGNMNGNVFSAARVIQVGAEEGHFPVIGAMFHRTLSTPVPALLVNVRPCYTSLPCLSNEQIYKDSVFFSGEQGMLTLVALMFDDVYSVISFLGPITWTITALSVSEGPSWAGCALLISLID